VTTGSLPRSIYFPVEEKISLFGRKKRVIVIAGPTATGKTKLSLEIAKLIHGEIISADSMQMYKGMDIGTAKASKDEREQVPHHMIDMTDVKNPCNVVDYFHHARKALRDILDHQAAPIVVGGSGFYLHVFLYGPPSGPPPDPKIRDHLERQYELLGAETLYEQLQIMDPEYAQTITENDKQKIVRALEIIFITGRKVSHLPKEPMVTKGEYDFRCWFIYYPKEILYPLIEKRCEEMIKQGFIEEVKELKKNGLLVNTSAASAIGYRQCLEYLQTNQTKQDYETFISEFKKASRHYAKRQFTWFRKEPYFRWINLEKIDIEKAKEYILQDFEQSNE
jgi:tRNA dimethylallyltransferase